MEQFVQLPHKNIMFLKRGNNDQTFMLLFAKEKGDRCHTFSSEKSSLLLLGTGSDISSSSLHNLVKRTTFPNRAHSKIVKHKMLTDVETSVI